MRLRTASIWQPAQQLLTNALKVMADNRLDAIVYRTMERSPSLIEDATTPPYRGGNGGTPILNTFLVYVPAITVPSGFTPDKLPYRLERSWAGLTATRASSLSPTPTSKPPTIAFPRLHARPPLQK